MGQRKKTEAEGADLNSTFVPKPNNTKLMKNLVITMLCWFVNFFIRDFPNGYIENVKQLLLK